MKHTILLFLITTLNLLSNDKITELDSLTKNILTQRININKSISIDDSILINFSDLYVKKENLEDLYLKYEFLDWDWRDKNVISTPSGKCIVNDLEYQCYKPYLINLDIKITFIYLFYNKKWKLYQIHLISNDEYEY